MSDSNQSSIPTISEEVHKDEEATSVEAPPATSAAGDSTSQDKSTTATIIATTTPAIPSRMLSAPPRMTQERQTLSGHALHDKLRTYESQRRLAHASKFETSTLHWKSYRDLLAASVQETARAQRIVMGTSRAHQLYSEALTAMYEDVFLDEKGNTMLKEKQQRKFYQVRKPSTRRIVSRTSLTGSSSDGSAVFASIRQAQHVFAERFGENAKNMDVEIGEEVGRLVEELKAQCSGMEKLGDAILAELEKTEQEVAAAWSTYTYVCVFARLYSPTYALCYAMTPTRIFFFSCTRKLFRFVSECVHGRIRHQFWNSTFKFGHSTRIFANVSFVRPMGKTFTHVILLNLLNFLCIMKNLIYVTHNHFRWA